MRVISKYPIKITDITVLSLPRGAEILCVQTQDELPCLFALVDPNQPADELVTIRIVGTGDPIDYIPKRYIGSTQTHGGEFIWHVFEQVERYESS